LSERSNTILEASSRLGVVRMKLYWRYKKDGKWMWTRADVAGYGPGSKTTVWDMMLEEEE